MEKYCKMKWVRRERVRQGKTLRLALYWRRDVNEHLTSPGSLNCTGRGAWRVFGKVSYTRPQKPAASVLGSEAGKGLWPGKAVGFCCTTQQLSSSLARCILYMQTPVPGQCMSHRLLSCIHSLELASRGLFQRNTQCFYQLTEDGALT